MSMLLIIAGEQMQQYVMCKYTAIATQNIAVQYASYVYIKFLIIGITTI